MFPDEGDTPDIPGKSDTPDIPGKRGKPDVLAKVINIHLSGKKCCDIYFSNKHH